MICPFCNVFCDDVDEFNDVCSLGYEGFHSKFECEIEKFVKALKDCRNPLFCISSVDAIEFLKREGFQVCKPYATCRLEDIKGRDLICYGYDPIKENPRLLTRFFRVGMNELVAVGVEIEKLATNFDNLESALEEVDNPVVIAKTVLKEDYLNGLIDYCRDRGVDLIFNAFIPEDFDFDVVFTSQSLDFERKVTFGVRGDLKCFEVGRVLRMDGVEVYVDLNLPSVKDCLHSIKK